MRGFRAITLFFVFALTLGGCSTEQIPASTTDTTADAKDVVTADTPSTPDADSSSGDSTNDIVKLPDTEDDTVQTESACKFPGSFEVHPQGAPLKVNFGQGEFVRMKGNDPFVMYDATIQRYRVWHTLYNNSTEILGLVYAESEDGVVWEKVAGLPFHVVPPSFEWDDHGPETAAVVQHNGTWYLWYTAKPCFVPAGEPGRNKCIGLATSTDGYSWEKHPTPVVQPTQPWEMPYQHIAVNENGQEYLRWEGGVNEPTVIRNDAKDRFEMWYEGHSMVTLTEGSESFTTPMHRVGFATSQDGISWEKHDDNPVFAGESGSWESPAFVGHTHMLKDPIVGYHLYYFSNHSLGHAYSVDGFEWERNPGNPLVTRSTQSQCKAPAGVCDPDCETGTCEPDCKNYWVASSNKTRECGPNGCGGSCGTCTWPKQHCYRGICVGAAGCTPDCQYKECGDDGCGGICAECGPNAPYCKEGRVAFGGPAGIWVDPAGVRVYHMRSREGAKKWGEGGMDIGLASGVCPP